ncbi:MAG: adenylyltransferase/cytidyltransferase family protein [Candidatus Saccharimonadales bacterium]
MNEDIGKKTIGYTAGVFDLFHIGHLNILRNAKSMCDHLIVGVTADELVKYKGKTAIIPFRERLEIVQSIEYVDTVVGQYELDKYKAWELLKFDKIFVGNDWFGSKEWLEYEDKFEKVGVEVIYFPYTIGTSSTIITDVLKNSHKLLEQAEKEEENSLAAEARIKKRKK